MKKAGLNPVLAYSQGGASAPLGSNASMEDVIGKSVSSAKQAATFRAELNSIKSDARVKNTQAELNESLAKLTDVRR